MADPVRRTIRHRSPVYNIPRYILKLMLNLPTTEERLGKSPRRLVRYFVLLMALVYLGIGIWLWWTSGQPAGGGLLQLGPTGRRVLGTVFILYGLVRFGRGYQANFRKSSSPDNE